MAGTRKAITSMRHSKITGIFQPVFLYDSYQQKLKTSTVFRAVGILFDSTVLSRNAPWHLTTA